MDEPPTLYRILRRYEQALLGALLIDPRRAFGPEVSRLETRDLSSELLARVLSALRFSPALSARRLLEVSLAGIRKEPDLEYQTGREILDALESAFPYNAEFYAAQIRRLVRSRRRFWRAMRRAHSRRFDLFREYPAE